MTQGTGSVFDKIFTWVQSVGWKDPLEEGEATHSSILAWRISWTIDMDMVTYGHGHKESDMTE